MKIKSINTVKKITPEDGLWLLNVSEKIISDGVYPGKHADISVWTEITPEEKALLEAQWKEEEEAELFAEEALAIIVGGDAV